LASRERFGRVALARRRHIDGFPSMVALGKTRRRGQPAPECALADPICNDTCMTPDIPFRLLV
jgi:hypothetical protein